MKIDCDFYYKCKTTNGFSFYGVKIITENSKEIDDILDQIASCNGTFIDKAEFNKNIKVPMLFDLMDNETPAKLIGRVVSEKIDLKKIKKGETVKI